MFDYGRGSVRGTFIQYTNTGVYVKTSCTALLFNAILSDSSSRVVTNGHLSEPFHITQGTRQGSIWSPFLYTIYINELLNNLCQSLF